MRSESRSCHSRNHPHRDIGIHQLILLILLISPKVELRSSGLKGAQMVCQHTSVILRSFISHSVRTPPQTRPTSPGNAPATPRCAESAHRRRSRRRRRHRPACASRERRRTFLRGARACARNASCVTATPASQQCTAFRGRRCDSIAAFCFAGGCPMQRALCAARRRPRRGTGVQTRWRRARLPWQRCVAWWRMRLRYA